MPNCTEERDLFGALGRRQIEVGFDGGEVSSDTGLLLLRQVERKLGLLKAAARVLPDPRNPDLIVHTTEQLLRQRVFGLCQGYEDLNDHDQLRLDPALQTALDKRGKTAASKRRVEPDAVPLRSAREPQGGGRAASGADRSVHRLVCRGAAGVDPRLRRDRRSGAWRAGRTTLQRLLRQLLFLAAVRVLRRAAVGGVPAFGQARCGAARGGDHEAAHAPPAPGLAHVRLVFRGDSGFCRDRLLAWCERNGVDYIVGLQKNSRLLAMAARGASRRRRPSSTAARRSACSASSLIRRARGDGRGG